MLARHWRSWLVIIAWLAAVVAAIVLSPSPPAPERPAGTGGEGLLRTLGLAAEPALLVFHRPGGLTADDQAFAAGLAGQAGLPAPGPANGETLALTAAAGPSDVPGLRARLRQAAPAGLETHVTGTPAFAHDAVAAWQWSRPFVLLAIALCSGLVALFARLGPGRAVVVAAGAGASGIVGSSLAALLAPPAPVALATVASAGLAAAWAVRLLMGTPLHRPLPFVPAPLSAGEPAPEQGAIAELTPLQRVLIAAGESTLLQALVILFGLAGFLFDYRAGLALLVGLAVAVGVGLSLTPALVAVLARPRRSPPPRGRNLRLWLRIVLLVLPIAGLLLLTPAARPADMAALGSDAAAGYARLAAAADPAARPARLLPLHLLIQSPALAREQAALQGLLADLQSRPQLAAVEGRPAAPDPSGDPATLAQLSADLLQAREELGTMEATLSNQAAALSQAISDVAGLGPAADLGPLQAGLDQALRRLDAVQSGLAAANANLARIPMEFPEISSRIDHVPVLRAMPETLAAAGAELGSISSQLRAAITQTTALAAPPSAAVAQFEARLAAAASSLEALAAEISTLRGDLDAAANLLAQAGREAPPAPGGAYQARHDLLRLALLPAADPYDPATLDAVPALQEAVQARLRGSPLADGIVAWAGEPAAAAAQRARSLWEVLLPGFIVAVVAVALAAWGTSTRLGPALLAAAGAVLSAAVGLGVAAALLRQVDAGAMALAAVALVPLAGGRVIVGRAPAVEDLVLVLPPLALLLTGVPALLAIGLALGAGLAAACWLIVPTLVRRPRPPEEAD